MLWRYIVVYEFVLFAVVCFDFLVSVNCGLAGLLCFVVLFGLLFVGLVVWVGGFWGEAGIVDLLWGVPICCFFFILCVVVWRLHSFGLFGFAVEFFKFVLFGIGLTLLLNDLYLLFTATVAY